MRPSRTLLGEALEDLRRELKRSRDYFGPVAAKRLGQRLSDVLRASAAGTVLGHRHPMLQDTPAAFRCVAVPPLIVVYNAERRSVSTIVDGRRYVAAIVARRLGEP